MLQNTKIKYRLLISRILFVVLVFGSAMINDSFAQNSLDTLQKMDKKMPINFLNLKIISKDSFANSTFSAIKKAENVSKLKLAIEGVLTQMEQNGYPFSNFYLDSMFVDSLGLNLNVKFNSEQLITYDSIDIGGTARITKSFLHNYLNIKVNEPYSEKQIKNLEARLSELPYIKVTRAPGVYFSGNKAKPVLYLENRKASSFDGIIGFAPNSQLNNKLVITGDLNLKLLNLAGSGKNLSLSFKSFLSGSQDLQAQFFWPFFLKTKLGLDYSFKLLRFDSTYLEIFNDLGFQYSIGGGSYLKMNLQQQQVNVLSPDTLYVRQTGKLPLFSDVKTTYYGLGGKLIKLDYALNPRRGYVLEFDFATGLKNILENNSLKEIKFSTSEGGIYNVYDSIQKNTIQYKSNINAAFYIPIGKNWVLANQLKTGWVYNSQLFLNELYRIGGIKTLKGFDEQSIFASTFAVLNIEMKYLFQQNSGFLLFANGAYYENKANPAKTSDWPYGIGAGMNLETGAGLFTLYYAVGSEKGNPLAWRFAKIHFGLLNFF